MKTTLHMQYIGPKVSSVSIYDQSFSRYHTFYDFLLTAMLKFQGTILKLGRLPRKVIAYIPHGSQCPH